MRIDTYTYKEQKQVQHDYTITYEYYDYYSIYQDLLSKIELLVNKLDTFLKQFGLLFQNDQIPLLDNLDGRRSDYEQRDYYYNTLFFNNGQPLFDFHFLRKVLEFNNTIIRKILDPNLIGIFRTNPHPNNIADEIRLLLEIKYCGRNIYQYFHKNIEKDLFFKNKNLVTQKETDIFKQEREFSVLTERNAFIRLANIREQLKKKITYENLFPMSSLSMNRKRIREEGIVEIKQRANMIHRPFLNFNINGLDKLLYGFTSELHHRMPDVGYLIRQNDIGPALSINILFIFYLMEILNFGIKQLSFILKIEPITYDININDSKPISISKPIYRSPIVRDLRSNHRFAGMRIDSSSVELEIHNLLTELYFTTYDLFNLYPDIVKDFETNLEKYLSLLDKPRENKSEQLALFPIQI